MKIVRLPQALVDLVETAEYIAEDNIDATDRFFDAFEPALKTIGRRPKIGTVRLFENRQEIRMWPIKSFEKCLIFYIVSADEIVILRVLHSARDYTRFLAKIDLVNREGPLSGFYRLAMRERCPKRFCL